jgi:thioredoxin reductase (NADPH)
MHQTDVIIIGAGPIGLFSVFQAGMLGMKCHVVDALDIIGGQCSALYPEKPIYDIPAHPEIAASDLIAQLKKQGAPFKPIYHLNQQVISLKESNNNFIVTTSSGTEISGKIILIAAGCGSFGPNRPPIAGIESYEGRSVFYNVSKKENFAGKEIVIAGGGDSAVDWAINLSTIAKKIYVVHRRNKFKAMPKSVAKLGELAKDTSKLELVIGYQLDELVGVGGALQEVIVKDLSNNRRNIKSDILLPFFGLSQELGPIAHWGLNVNLHHIEVSTPYYETNIGGIYAAGDIASYIGKLKLILTGFAESASALHHAYSRVFEGKALHFEYSTTKGVAHL